MLDLFAGSGALGLEALSRGAASVVFVDDSRSAVRTIRENLSLVDATDRASVVQRDVFKYLDAPGLPRFDVALADPPYGAGLAERLLHRFREAPFADELWVEHRSSEVLTLTPEMRQRRYGDTTLTLVQAPE